MADILVIDDHEDTRTIFRIALEGEGHVVRTARDGGAGLALALTEGPDLIILDLRLPVLHGWTLLERLRDTPEGRDVPVLLVTADGESVRERALEADTQGVLLKPVRLKDLLEHTRRCLEEATAGS